MRFGNLGLLLLYLYVLWANCAEVNVFSSRDTYIDQFNPSTAFPNSDYLVYSNRAGEQKEIFLSFDLTNYRRCINRMLIYLYPTTSTDDSEAEFVNTKVDITAATWTSSITWNGRSSISVLKSFTTTFSESTLFPGYYSVELSKDNLWSVLKDYNYTVGFRLSMVSSSSFTTSFDSHEQSTSRRPFMRLVYESCSSNAKCAAYSILGSISSIECVCNTGFSGNGETCTDINDCSPNPCSNGATCTDTGVNSYSCTCSPGFSGTRCTTNINDCSPNPCQNGGTCADGINSFTCSCISGFNGKRCENNIDDCTPNPCLNGGSCTDGLNTFTCSCSGGYTGKTCETFMNSCAGNPCQNGGQCSNIPNSYSCTCPSGFQGTNCEININDCTPSSCLNNGLCVDGIDSFNCQCDGTGFTGGSCNININDCASNQCLNGATCQDQINSYTCQCANGFVGDFCEINIDECASAKCQNDGVCVDQVNNYLCQCPIGWKGKECDTPIQCFGELFQNANYQTVQSGVVGFGSCVEGYFGSPRRECSQTNGSDPVGLWLSVSSPCSPRFCEAYQSASVSFPITQAGLTATGTCKPLYSSSIPPKLNCSFDGFWGNVEGDCEEIFCSSEVSLNATWEETKANGTAFGVCLEGFGGFLQRTCSESGSWSEAVGSCIANEITCLPETYGNAKWARAEGNSIIKSNGCLDGYAGDPTRKCFENGTWDMLLNGTCSKLPASPTNFTVDIAKNDQATISWIADVDASYYEVLISTNDLTYFTASNGLGDSVFETEFLITGLIQFTRYFVRIYSVNDIGKSTSFLSGSLLTEISPPTNLQVLQIISNQVSFGWSPSSLSQWHHIFFSEGGIIFRRNDDDDDYGNNQAKRFVENGFQYSGSNSITVTNLNSSTDYTFYIYSGRGETYFEPIGLSFSITTKASPTEPPTEPPTSSPTDIPTNSTGAPTDSPTEVPTNTPTEVPTNTPTEPNNTGNESGKKEDNTGMIVGIVVGILACLILMILAFVLFYRRRNSKDTKKRLPSVTDTSLPLEEYKKVDRGNSLGGTNKNNDSTLMNTTLEVSLPGFLTLDTQNHIRKEDKIGSGGCSIIYKGIILNSDIKKRNGFEKIAIKEITASPMAFEDMIDQFKQEVAIMWSLSTHPNIIRLVGYSESPLTIVTKLYEFDLSSLIHNPNFDMTTAMKINFLKDICSGMLAIHETSIVHRDLKTANILVESETRGSSIILKPVICDFGIARVATDSRVKNQRFIDVKGMSPRYCAPETFLRVRLGETVDIEIEKKSDIYSFAIVTWEMIHRKKPWVDRNADEIESLTNQGVRLPIDDSQDPAIMFLNELVKKCWDATIQNRPPFKLIQQSMQAL